MEPLVFAALAIANAAPFIAAFLVLGRISATIGDAGDENEKA